MRFGIAFANTGPLAEGPIAAGVARAVEAAGFESVWTVEHVLVPVDYQSTYPYAKSGRMPGGESFDIPDPLVWLAYVAAATTTIRRPRTSSRAARSTIAPTACALWP